MHKENVSNNVFPLTKRYEETFTNLTATDNDFWLYIEEGHALQ